jgi:hypothetical protein
VVKLRGWTGVGVLACAVLVLGTAPASAPGPVLAFTPIAHSAQLTAEGAVAAGTLILRVQRAAGRAPLTGAALAVSIDGRSLPATALADGSWVVQLHDLPSAGAGKLDLVVTHDGVRELLSGTLPGAAASGRSSAPDGAASRSFARHKQLLWWILNIAIVLIGAIAISRRRS